MLLLLRHIFSWDSAVYKLRITGEVIHIVMLRGILITLIDDVLIHLEEEEQISGDRI